MNKRGLKIGKKNIEKRKFCRPYVYYGLWIFLGILLVVALVCGVTLFKNEISGRAVFEIEADYQEGQPLGGNLRFSLKEGELIPSSSKIIFETSGGKYEYDLNEFVSNDLVEGDFYIEGESISGTGLGYGTKGIKTIYPKVYFTLGVYSQTSSEETSDETGGEESEIEEVVIEEIEEAEEEIEAEEIEEEEVESKIETPITGNIVTKLSDGISNFFLGFVNILKKISNFFLGLTGRVSMEFETEVEGEVLAGQPFTYNLEEGQTAEIVSSSQNVELNVEDGVATVTTSYFEEEEGFGEDYLGDIEKVLDIDLSELDLLFGQEELKISLVYDEEEIVSLLTQLGEGKETEEEIEKEEEEEKEEVVFNETEEEEEETEELTNVLTDEERRNLVEEFGNASIEITKAELVEGGKEITFQLRDYSTTRFYDSALSDKDLELQMESDRIKWLKDIAKTLSQKKTVPEKIEKFIGNYPI